MLCLLFSPVTLQDARLLLIRHGRTEMNEHLAANPFTTGFKDPGFFDTELTRVGQQQAQQLRLRMSGLPRVDTLISSPLRRALHTAEIVFEGADVARRIVTPLAAERLFLSSDVGAPVAELAARFDTWQIQETLQERWWFQGDERAPEWRPAGTYLVPGEPQQAFAERMNQLIRFLQSVEPSPCVSGGTGCVALVCHAEVIYALTGKNVDNCALVDTQMSELSESVTGYILECT